MYFEFYKGCLKMNECFFIGKIIKIGKFKFICSSKTKHMSEIKIKLKLLDGTIINVIGYDAVADYILRNVHNENIVFINGRVICKLKEIYIKMCHIEKIKF